MRILIDKVAGYFNLQPIYAALRAANDGSFAIAITRLRKGRTLKQNDYLWGCVYPTLLDGLLDAGWEFTSLEQVHEFFKRLYAHEQLVNKDTGEVVILPSSTATMDTQQFKTYLERLQSYAMEYLNITIPEPDKYRCLWGG